ncbi:MAG: M50 family metallopeptidase [Lysinibacillus sp.]
MILLSLLWHEGGHLLAAKLCGVKVKACVISPYGGEIEFENPSTVKAKSMLWIALGGPIATIIGIVVAMWAPDLIARELVHIQLILLVFNLVPVLPLDGGRIILACILLFYPYASVYEFFHSLSLIVVTIMLVIPLCLLPQSIFFVILCLFIWLQVIKEWSYRKYRLAFEKYVMHRLT